MALVLILVLILLTIIITLFGAKYVQNKRAEDTALGVFSIFALLASGVASAFVEEQRAKRQRHLNGRVDEIADRMKEESEKEQDVFAEQRSEIERLEAKLAQMHGKNRKNYKH
jgi:uncharacterized protein HemX